MTVPIVFCADLLLASGVQAESTPAALGIGKGRHASLPAIFPCACSTHVVSAALRALDFDGTDREDASSGVDAGNSKFHPRDVWQGASPRGPARQSAQNARYNVGSPVCEV